MLFYLIFVNVELHYSAKFSYCSDPVCRFVCHESNYAIFDPKKLHTHVHKSPVCFHWR